MIVLKSSRQIVSAVNELLERQLSRIKDEEYGLFIVKEDQIRELK